MEKNLITESNGVFIYRKPTDEYLKWAEENNAVFDNEQWANILKLGFEVEVYYVWDSTLKCGKLLTIFNKYFIKIGFIGFPVSTQPSCIENDTYDLGRIIDTIKKSRKAIHLIRIPISSFGNEKINNFKFKKDCSIETSILKLNSWDLDKKGKSRRNYKLAEKNCSTFTLVKKASGIEMHSLYESAVKRNKGDTKYTLKYFDAMSNSLNFNNIKLFGLKKGDLLISMIITAKHGDNEYYLHSGTLPEYMNLRAPDYLMVQAINSAKSNKSVGFNFLSSPEKQPGLIRFKEKWGGESRQAFTYSIPLTRLGSLIIFVLRILQKK